MADGPPGFEKTRHKCLNWRMFCVSQHDYESWEILASVNGAPMEHLDFRLSESRMGPSVLSSYLSRRANRVLAAKKKQQNLGAGDLEYSFQHGISSLLQHPKILSQSWSTISYFHRHHPKCLILQERLGIQ